MNRRRTKVQNTLTGYSEVIRRQAEERRVRRAAMTDRERMIEDAPLRLYWRWHEGDKDNATHVRVWRSDWFGDQFEIMDRAEFGAMIKYFERFSVPVLEALEQ